MPKILIISSNISKESGGLRTGTINICNALAKRGWIVSLYTTTFSKNSEFNGKIKVMAELKGVDTHYFKCQRIIWGNIISLGMLVRLLFLPRKNFDLVLVQSMYQFNSTFAALVCRAKKIPYILRPHGTLDPVLLYRRRVLLKKLYISMLEKPNFSRAKAIQYSSQQEMDMTDLVFKGSAGGIIISEGISPEEYKNFDEGEFVRRFPQFSNSQTILFLGRLHQKKGVDLAIKAFRKISHQFADSKMAIIGTGDQSYIDGLAGLIDELNMNNRIYILGGVNNSVKLAAFHAADVFILPSYGENFGLAVVEAALCSLPMAISNRVAIAPQLKEGGAAIICECNSDAFASALEHLLQDSEMRYSMSLAGPKVVEAYFTVEKMGNALDIAYKKILGSN